MTQTELNYAKVLYELSIPEDEVRQSMTICREVPQLVSVLADPTVAKEHKHVLIERIFPERMHSFLKKASDMGRAENLQGIFEAWETYVRERRNQLKSVLLYVTPPTQEQQEGFVRFLKTKYGCSDAGLTLVQDKSLLGGFILRIGSTEYDYSLRGRLNGLRRQMIRR